jgi:hypothetical protein
MSVVVSKLKDTDISTSTQLSSSTTSIVSSLRSQCCIPSYVFKLDYSLSPSRHAATAGASVGVGSGNCNNRNSRSTLHNNENNMNESKWCATDVLDDVHTFVMACEAYRPLRTQLLPRLVRLPTTYHYPIISSPPFGRVEYFLLHCHAFVCMCMCMCDGLLQTSENERLKKEAKELPLKSLDEYVVSDAQL